MKFKACRLGYLIIILIFSVLCMILYQIEFVENVFCQPGRLQVHERYPFNGNGSEFNLGKSPPVVVKPIGGLGNQLFQYACAYALAKQRNSDLYLCVPNDWEKNNRWPFSIINRTYSVDILAVPDHKILIDDGKDSCKTKLSEISNGTIFYTKEEDIIMEKVPDDKPLSLYGYMESEIFFKHYKEDILELFSLEENLKNRQEIRGLLAEITQNQNESVAIHVRRGDFAVSHGGRILPISYYERAIKLMKTKIEEKFPRKNITFIVFSDDIKAVKEDFKNISEYFVYASNDQFSRVDDFLLMSVCKHNIIANSTFSWWSAYLNRNLGKIVIAPSPKFKPEWYNMYKDRRFLIQIYGGVWTYPYDWSTIDPYTN